MSDNEMLYCLIAFILGWLISRHMGGEGFAIGAPGGCFTCTTNSGTAKEFYNYNDCKSQTSNPGGTYVSCNGGKVYCNAAKIIGPCRACLGGLSDDTFDMDEEYTAFKNYSQSTSK